MEIGAFDDPKIIKKILHAGKEFKPIEDGTKVFFHFVTRKCDDNNTIIDDSRKMGKPMELVIGKKFKLEVWETIVRAMAIGEVSLFKIDKTLVYSYPVVSKTLRDTCDPNGKKRNHVCAHTVHTMGIGYPDLDDLLKKPVDLEFTIELLKVKNQGEYEKESWQLSGKDKLLAVPLLRSHGNALFKNGSIESAMEKYSTAIGYLDQLMLCEKPGDVDWTALNDQKLPLLLNYSQCKLNLKEYYAVIEHCSTVLQYQPDNTKALFKRGKAHMNVWNAEEAQKDLLRVAEIDPSLQGVIQSLLKQLDQSLKEKDSNLKQNIQGKLFSS